ncbi:hypothetical protein C8F04DRAFT_1104775 [Mycena alexandri]|uniref:DUF6535 domain-containing protein n=1 Tax=Mycena alexandri TaxID=1745969 RepID=A0AAD6ST47_9AGAR|nr:hypothetical protein C8F04DRAFT_1104775 [Mycena alexandri]
MPEDAGTPAVAHVDSVNSTLDDSDETSWAKIWSVYISEAEKYDKVLVESWKGDMEGLLIFAGLFSASLTAFIIESYKTLTPDSGVTTAALLNQISKQLAASASGTTFEIPAPPVFVVPVTSIVCNVLWFISLGLSLACALVATLVEQWARDFSQKANMRPSPVIRARIFAYLYYGLKRFNMHIVAEVVPLLLHVSLVLFFAGLIAFLLPIHPAVMGVSAALLGIILIVYCSLTVLPLIYFDCPYQTPLSSVLWRISQLWRLMASNLWVSPRRQETMVEGMLRQATQPSAERDERDLRALSWTMKKSLVDHTELEPFIAGIPDVIWGPNGRKYNHNYLIRTLLDDPEVRLGYRVLEFMRYSDSGLLTPVVESRHKISCLTALWSICALWEKSELGREVSNLLPAVQAMLERVTLSSLDIAWQNSIQNLQACRASRAVAGDPSISHLYAGLAQIVEYSRGVVPHFPDPTHLMYSLRNTRVYSATLFRDIQTFLDTQEINWTDTRHIILAKFLRAAVSSPEDSKTVYHFAYTLKILQNNLAPPSALNEIYVDVLETIVQWVRAKEPNVLAAVLSIFFPVRSDSPPSAPLEKLWEVLDERTCNLSHLWAAITDYLRAGCPCSNDTEQTLEVMWHLNRVLRNREGVPKSDWVMAHLSSERPWFTEFTLSTIQALPDSVTLPCVLALVKTRILASLFDQQKPIAPVQAQWDECKQLLSHPLLSQHSLGDVTVTLEFGLDADNPTDVQILHCACCFELQVVGLRNRLSETLTQIVPERGGFNIFLVHPNHRLRFAKSLSKLIEASTISFSNRQLWLHLISDSPLFGTAFKEARLYFEMIRARGELDVTYDTTLILALKNMLAEYAEVCFKTSLRRVQELLASLEALLEVLAADGPVPSTIATTFVSQ